MFLRPAVTRRRAPEPAVTLLLCGLLLTGCAASTASPVVPFDEPTIQGSLPSAPSVEDLLPAAPSLAPVATDEPTPEQPPADVAAAASATYEQFKALPKADQLTYVTWVFRAYKKFLADYKSVGGHARDFTLPSQSLTNTTEQIESTNIILDRMMIAQNDPLVRRELNYAMHIDGDMSADLDKFEQYMNDNIGDGPGRSARVQAAKGGLVLPDDHDTDKQPMLRKDPNGLDSVNIEFQNNDTSVAYLDFFYVPIEHSYMPDVDALWIPR